MRTLLVVPSQSFRFREDIQLQSSNLAREMQFCPFSNVLDMLIDMYKMHPSAVFLIVPLKSVRGLQNLQFMSA